MIIRTIRPPHNLQIQNFRLMRDIMKSILFLVALMHLTHISFSQGTDSSKTITSVSGSVSVTNNGISIVPTFSLDKPAAIFDLAVTKNRFSYEQDLRFSLKGVPWGFIFWGRYKLVPEGKFQMSVGTHFGLNFMTSVVPINGDSSEVTIVRRYVAGELFPRFLLSKNITVGLYYLYSHGIDEGTIKNTNFLTLNANFSDIKLWNQFFMNISPQFYYLKLDAQDGFYFSSALTAGRKNFPLFVSGIINQTINSDITGNKNFVWNVSLVYTINKIFVEQKMIMLNQRP